MTAHIDLASWKTKLKLLLKRTTAPDTMATAQKKQQISFEGLLPSRTSPE
jgi:hypothetical protein